MGPLLTQCLGLICVAIGLLVYALQPPHTPIQPLRHPDIYFAIDSSTSMMAQDVHPNRLAVAKQQATELARLLGNYRLGIIQFAGDARITCPLTQDLASVQQRIASISPLYDWPGSRLSDAILAAYRGFLNQSSDPVLVIWSDGDSTAGDAYRMLFYANQLNMRIISIGMGSLDGDPVPKLSGGFEKENGAIILSKLNRDTLMGIAEQTQGHYLEATKTPAIPQRVYTHIMQMRGPTQTSPAPINPMPILIIGVGLLLVPFLYSRPWILLVLLVHTTAFASLPSHWHNHEAKLAWRQNNPSLAMRQIQTMADTPGTSPDWLWFNRGKLHQARGEYAQAAQAFAHSHSVYEQAISLYMMGQFDTAMTLLKPLIIQNPLHESARVLFEHAYRNNATVETYPPEPLTRTHTNIGPMPLPASWQSIEAIDTSNYQNYNQTPTPSIQLEGRTW